MMKISEADVVTEHATSYLRQLCRHWSHRFDVQFDDLHGRIALPEALCTLNATPALLQVRLELTEAADPARVEQVVAEHLQRFGFKEQLVFPWRRSE
ncbi:MAG: DUF2218 domain-containing protein [Janthinobacterium lividum]